jgi:hypothetical protein
MQAPVGRYVEKNPSSTLTSPSRRVARLVTLELADRRGIRQ